MKEFSSFLGKCLLYLVIWGGFVGIITNIDKTTISDLPILANGIIILIVFLAPIWLGKTIWDKGENITQNISSKLKDSKEKQEAIKSTKESLAIYNDAKKRFKYLSDETLFLKYDVDMPDDMIKLALEEELVDRKLLPHSLMHEKLDSIMGKFKKY